MLGTACLVCILSGLICWLICSLTPKLVEKRKIYMSQNQTLLNYSGLIFTTVGCLGSRRMLLEKRVVCSEMFHINLGHLVQIYKSYTDISCFDEKYLLSK